MTIAHSTDNLRRTITSRNRASFFKGHWRAIQAWRERERIRTELLSFSDRELRDIVSHTAKSTTSSRTALSTPGAFDHPPMNA
jgi:uncharacterized protein YjiS (DUF1127 family)